MLSNTVHYYKLVKNLDFNLKPYVNMPVYDEHPDYGSFKSVLGVPHPGKEDYIIHSNVKSINFYSTFKDFSEVEYEFLHKLNITKLLENKTIIEVDKETFELDIKLMSEIDNLKQDMSNIECALNYTAEFLDDNEKNNLQIQLNELQTKFNILSDSQKNLISVF